MTLRRTNIRTKVTQETQAAQAQAQAEVQKGEGTATSEEAAPLEEIQRPTQVSPESIPIPPKEDKSKQSDERERMPIQKKQAQDAEPGQITLLPFSDREREHYPEGESFDKRYEYFPTHVLRGMRELIEHVMGETGYKKSQLTAIAFIALLEDEFGYDMSAYREKLPQYYKLKELREKLKEFEEAEQKKVAQKKKRKKENPQ